jgi:hypothetical protein
MMQTRANCLRETISFVLILSSAVGMAVLVPGLNLYAQQSDKSKTGSAAAAEPQLVDDLEEAIRVVEKDDFKTFLERYAPVDMLRQLRQQDLLDRAAAVMAAQPQTKTQLVAMLKALQKQTPKYDKSRGLATIQFDAIASGIEAAPPEIRLTLTDDAKQTGLGDDLKKVLADASKLLAAGDVEKFVERMFPASELARLQQPGAMQDLVHQIKAKANTPDPSGGAAGGGSISRAKPRAKSEPETPSLLEALQEDFKLLQTLTPELTDNGQVAIFRIKFASDMQSERVVKFQKIGNDWRLFDNSARVTDELARQFKLKPRSAITTVTMERIGGNWRFIELPALEMRGR